jgi:uncharacterized RDD family membrane protein YckC
MVTEIYRTGLKRIWAAIVDGIVFMPFMFINLWLMKKTEDTPILISWTILTAFLPLLYSVLLHFKYGQTIGKWVAGVKVVDVSEIRTLTFKQSVLRDVFYLGIEVVGLLYFTILVFQTDKAEYLYNDYRNFADQPILWWTFIELVTMLTNSKRRALHDLIAKSVVVRV